MQKSLVERAVVYLNVDLACWGVATLYPDAVPMLFDSCTRWPRRYEASTGGGALCRGLGGFVFSSYVIMYLFPLCAHVQRIFDTNSLNIVCYNVETTCL